MLGRKLSSGDFLANRPVSADIKEKTSVTFVTFGCFRFPVTPSGEIRRTMRFHTASGRLGLTLGVVVFFGDTPTPAPASSEAVRKVVNRAPPLHPELSNVELFSIVLPTVLPTVDPPVSQLDTVNSGVLIALVLELGRRRPKNLAPPASASGTHRSPNPTARQAARARRVCVAFSPLWADVAAVTFPK